MTDLIYTATEARNDFFNMLIAAKKGDRRVVVKNRKLKFEIKLLDEVVPEKKPSWDDFFGKGSKKVARDIIRAKKLVDKVSLENIKTW
jgi:hypothetical protein